MPKLIVEISDEIRRKIKMEAARQDKSIKQYITKIIVKDLEKE